MSMPHPIFFAIPPEYSGIFHIPPDPRSKIPHALLGKSWIQDPPVRIWPNIANILYSAGSKIQDSLGKSWIQDSPEYSPNVANILYSAGSKIQIQNSSKTPWENLGSRTLPNIARIFPNILYSAGSKIQDPRFPTDSLGKCWILDPTEYRIFAIFGCIRDPRFSQGVRGKSWILDFGSSRI